jgi:hypothetical protein
MKCLKHASADAVAICAYCGRALCPDCIHPGQAPRLTCSDACAERIAQSDRALKTILEQNFRNARASAFYCYLCAGLSGAAAVVAWFMLPSPFLILFTAGCAVVLLVSGMWYSRSGRNAEAAPDLQNALSGKMRVGGALTNEVGRR